jgi:hypothetical protein
MAFFLNLHDSQIFVRVLSLYCSMYHFSQAICIGLGHLTAYCSIWSYVMSNILNKIMCYSSALCFLRYTVLFLAHSQPCRASVKVAACIHPSVCMKPNCRMDFHEVQYCGVLLKYLVSVGQMYWTCYLHKFLCMKQT